MNTELGQQLQRFIPFDDWSLDIINELLPHFRNHQLPPSKVLFKRGQVDEECHFLISGAVDLADADFKVTTLTAEDDDNFMALDNAQVAHRYAAITKTECNIISIQRSHLELISTWSELCHSFNEDDDSDWLERLVTSELFNRVPAGNIQKLLSRFTELPVVLGDVVIKEGEPGDKCFVIKQGKAIVSRLDSKGKPQTIAALQHGDMFGEDALVSSLPRNASVTMSSDGILMALSKEDFDSLLRNPIMTYVTRDELQNLIAEADTGTVVIDVRHEQEALSDPNLRAQNIPLAQLRDRLKDLESAFLYVVSGGARAEAAAYILNEAGFQAHVLKED